jgi:hypothetical protein
MHSKIASLYSSFGDEKNASLWERRIIDIARREGANVTSMINYCDIHVCVFCAGMPVSEYAKSCMHLAQFHIDRSGVARSSSATIKLPKTSTKTLTPEELRAHLRHAGEYLRVVAESNAEESLSAGDLLRRIEKLEMKGSAVRRSLMESMASDTSVMTENP